MERSKDEDAVFFEVVVVSKAEDGEEEEKMSTKKMKTNGIHIEEVVGESFKLKEHISLKYNVTIVTSMVTMPLSVQAQDKW